jgi:hypothetical protein
MRSLLCVFRPRRFRLKFSGLRSAGGVRRYCLASGEVTLPKERSARYHGKAEIVLTDPSRLTQ